MEFYMLLVGVLCLSAAVVEAETMKCWFGEPHTDTSYSCYNSNVTSGVCPSNYICVLRHDYTASGMTEMWRGCCPEGNGPCHKEMQPIDPIDGAGDRNPPSCDDSGYYQPRQCQLFGCYCVFPNGTTIDGTITMWEDGPINCTQTVNRMIAGLGQITTSSPITSTLPALCQLPAKRGVCKAYIRSWYYNTQSQQCDEFTYGGCEGNDNRFSDKNTCEQTCNHGTKTCPGNQVWSECGSPCTNTCEKKSQPCILSCQARCECPRDKPLLHNGECIEEHKCPAVESTTMSSTTITATTIPALCQLTAVSGPCEALIRSWFFNTNTKQCEQFEYGGCDGNGNRFSDKASCEKTCRVKKTCPSGQIWNDCGSFCTKTCETKMLLCATVCEPRCECPRDKPILHNGECIEEHKCPAVKSSTTATAVPAICQMPADSGPCEALGIQWYFNTNTKQCEQFNYGGCDGNANRFADKTSCEMICRTNKSCPSGQVWDDCGFQCTLTCENKVQSCTAVCQPRCACPRDKPFLHNGQCIEEQKCPTIKSSTTMSTTTTTATAVPAMCQMPADSGPCEALRIQWYFNTNTKQCEQFNYGGCDGNANRFADKTSCEMICRTNKSCPSGQVWDDCGFQCTLTCENKIQSCSAVCQPRCECPRDKPMLHNDQCIEEQKCPTKPKVFKCWFGEPHSDTSSTCYDPSISMGSCPSNYVCVNRRVYERATRETWRGCCPQGQNPCHKALQLIDPSDAALDVLPPKCDKDGFYAATQCSAWGICSCVLPNGTYIQNTETFGNKPLDNCTEIVNGILGKKDVFKCWFGQPLEKGEAGCHSDYISVTRHSNNHGDIVESWEGCCPRGKGPCDEGKQRMETPGVIMDIPEPVCDLEGNYIPRQCGMAGCSCVMPNGTNIKNSLQFWDDDNNPERCNDMVKNILEGNKNIFKCWFGLPLEKEAAGCPTGYISVTRQANNGGRIYNSWEGCCPKGNGPCEEEKQKMETPGLISDMADPACDISGNFLPMQCGMAGCSCVMPDGEYLENSHRFWDDDNNPERCNDMVKKTLGACEIGLWGLDCDKNCQCSAGESCDRLDGSSCRNKNKRVIVIALSILGVLFLFALAFTIYCAVNAKRKSVNVTEKGFYSDNIVEVKIPYEKHSLDV